MKTYFALTLGPIYKTLALARKTRELWAASYLFSSMTENLVKLFEKDERLKLIIPASINSENFIAGLFPDRLILQVLDVKLEYNSLTQVVDNINKGLFEDWEFKKKQKIFFLEYLQIYSLRISLSDNDDPLKVILPLLDSMEQKSAYVAKFEHNEVENFLKEINKREKFETIFGKNYRFPSLLEIATTDLKELRAICVPELIKNFNKAEPEIYNRIFDFCLKKDGEKEKNSKGKEFIVSDATTILLLKEAYNPKDTKNKDDERFRLYHKYVAMVQADGDNISQALHAIYCMGGIKGVQKFSRFLMNFGKEATTKIKEYGGIPIYMGGDDLLFFAPVKVENKCIFDLVKDIDEKFKSLLIDQEEITDYKEITGYINDWNESITIENQRNRVDISMSFAISINYHKFPLKESLENVRQLLFNGVKFYPGKNAVALSFQKHSGHTYNTFWGKLTNIGWTPSFDMFLEMLSDKTVDMKFLSSLQYKLEPLRPLIYRILTDRFIDPTKAGFKQNIVKYLPDELLRELFFKRLTDNLFNELAHNELKEFLERSFYYLLHTYRELEDIYGNNSNTAEKAIDNLYACLRFMQFLRQPDINEEEE